MLKYNRKGGNREERHKIQRVSGAKDAHDGPEQPVPDATPERFCHKSPRSAVELSMPVQVQGDY